VVVVELGLDAKWMEVWKSAVDETTDSRAECADAVKGRTESRIDTTFLDPQSILTRQASQSTRIRFRHDNVGHRANDGSKHDTGCSRHLPSFLSFLSSRSNGRGRVIERATSQNVLRRDKELISEFRYTHKTMMLRGLSYQRHG
jgi:hypothetical protein